MEKKFLILEFIANYVSNCIKFILNYFENNAQTNSKLYFGLWVNTEHFEFILGGMNRESVAFRVMSAKRYMVLIILLNSSVKQSYLKKNHAYIAKTKKKTLIYKIISTWSIAFLSLIVSKKKK